MKKTENSNAESILTNVQPPAVKKERDARFELMRVVCMILIVTSHSIWHSGLLDSMELYSINFILVKFVRCLCRVSVSAFVMVNGFFMYEKQLHLKKIVLLVYEVLFYSLCIYLILCLLGYETFRTQRFLWALFPVMSKVYWFVTCYVLLLLFTPLLNTAIAGMGRKLHLTVLITLGAVYTVAAILMQWAADFSQVGGGSSVSFFMFLYLLAAYIRKYTVPPSGPGKYILGYLGLAAFMTVLALLMTALGETIDEDCFNPDIFLNRNSIFAVGAALCFFQFFRCIPAPGARASAVILKLSGLVFAVYLIHDNYFFRRVLWRRWTHVTFYAGDLRLWPYILLCVVCVFTACVLIELVRKTISGRLGIENALECLCDRIEASLSARLDEKIN